MKWRRYLTVHAPRSRDWVQYALARPAVTPAGHAGGPMIYSTGNTHLIAAALTRAAGESLDAYYARVPARPLGIAPRPWPTAPRGIYLGGNAMRMTPREMARFGGLYLHRGVAPPGTPAGPVRVNYAWGYGGQFVFVVPRRSLVVVVTSDPDAPECDWAHLSAVHALLDTGVLPAVGG